MTYIATNIKWNIDMEEVFEYLDSMTAKDAAEALEIGFEKYANMTTDERHDYAYDAFDNHPAMLGTLFCLPEEIRLPEKVCPADGESTNGFDWSEATDWISNEWEYCINDYDVRVELTPEKAVKLKKKQKAESEQEKK